VQDGLFSLKIKGGKVLQKTKEKLNILVEKSLYTAAEPADIFYSHF
jgi:hypothetical protein